MTELQKLEKALGVKSEKHHFPDEYGRKLRLKYPNGYGVSIICGPFSYGGPELLELAVLKDGKLCYDTPITSDVEAYLTAEEALALIKKVEALPKPKTGRKK